MSAQEVLYIVFNVSIMISCNKVQLKLQGLCGLLWAGVRVRPRPRVGLPMVALGNVFL